MFVEKQQKGRYRMKLLKLIQNLISAFFIILIIVLLGMFFIPQLLGYNIYNVTTGSMQPNYPIGSMIYVKEIPFADIEVGDVVTFQSDSAMVVTHRVKSIDVQKQTLCTQGDANNTEDGILSYEKVIGRSSDFAIPYLGQVVMEFQEGKERKIAIGALIGLMLLWFIMDCVAKPKPRNEESAFH